jgi:hypothetical protein
LLAGRGTIQRGKTLDELHPVDHFGRFVDFPEQLEGAHDSTNAASIPVAVPIPEWLIPLLASRRKSLSSVKKTRPVADA